MFSAFNTARNVITVFHSPLSPASKRIVQAIKAARSAKPNSHVDVEVLERAPTADQLKTIVEYAGGARRIGSIVPGAESFADAVKKLETASGTAEGVIVRPIVVDWLNGKAVLGDDEQGVKKLIEKA
ncbi:thioredoxin-like protein [Dipodascopsis uninucleata]